MHLAAICTTQDMFILYSTYLEPNNLLKSFDFTSSFQENYDVAIELNICVPSTYIYVPVGLKDKAGKR
jgi:hypothetical protein